MDNQLKKKCTSAIRRLVHFLEKEFQKRADRIWPDSRSPDPSTDSSLADKLTPELLAQFRFMFQLSKAALLHTFLHKLLHNIGHIEAF